MIACLPLTAACLVIKCLFLTLTCLTSVSGKRNVRQALGKNVTNGEIVSCNGSCKTNNEINKSMCFDFIMYYELPAPASNSCENFDILFVSIINS